MRRRLPLFALLLGAVAAAAVTVAVPVEQPSKAAATVTRPTGCWVEKWQQDLTEAEVICGSLGLRPAGSLDVGAQVLVDGRPWVATVTGIEPVGAN